MLASKESVFNSEHLRSVTNLKMNSISVISGRWLVIMKSCVQRNPVYVRKDSRLKRGSNPGPLDRQASV